MTISATTRIAGPYDGGSAVVQFPFDFKVFSDSEIMAILYDRSATVKARYQKSGGPQGSRPVRH